MDEINNAISGGMPPANKERAYLVCTIVP